MRRPLRTALLYTCLAGVLAAAGCTSGPSSSHQPPLYSPPAAPQANANARTGGVTAADRADSPTPDEMQRLLTRLDSLEMDNAQLKRQLSDRYMEEIKRRRAELEAQPGADDAAADSAADAQDGAPASAGDRVKQPASPADFSRAELLDALVNKIIEGDDPARTRALMVAAISVASRRHELDHRLLDGLDPKSREQVARFHQMLAVIYDELAGDAGRTLTRREMIAKIDEVFGAQPLMIEALELCRRVDSYGVYEPFASSRFLSGRQNRVLVYVELENFHHEPTEDGQYLVSLEQSVELYDATGETTVWRQGPVSLDDTSRNKRRDFFIVFPIELPARLPAGGYRLKVRVADKHTGSICEQTLHDIKIVADSALVENGQ